jgi:hypothetical protein
MKIPILVAAIVVLSGSLNAQNVSFDDVARFVAGKPLTVSSPLNQLIGRPAVRKHYYETGELSTKWEEGRLKAIKQWAMREIQPQLTRPQCVKYMFGGPDFVHATTVFPGVPEYILAGLEPLGTIPDFFAMSEAELQSYLTHLNYTLRSISRRNFFITKEMREDFGKQGIDGVFPVLLYFASLTGHEVLDANYVTLEANGNVVQSGAADATGIWLRIREVNPTFGDPAAQNLYYFKTDLSDAGFKNGSPFHQFLASKPNSVGYLKAASFLMHTDAFTNIRNFLVGDCQFILQDASGIPAEFFATYYNVSYYGNYVGPIDMFSEYDQPFLHRIYQSGVAKNLPFGTGYRMKDSDSIQMFGVRK